MQLIDFCFSAKKRYPHKSSPESPSRPGFPRLIFVVLIFVFAAPGCASLAEPQIQPAIHELRKISSDKDEFLIRGADFTEADHGLTLKDTGKAVILFKQGKISSVPHDKLWDKLGSPWAKALERRKNANGKQGHYQAKGKSYNGYLKPLENAGSDKLFVSWRLKLSESPSHSKGSNKFIRIWDQTNGKGTRISWTQMHLTYNGSKKPSWGGWPGKANQWNQMSLWVDGKQGEIQARVNDKLAHDISDFKKADTDKGLNIKLIGFDPNRSTPYEDMEVGIEDLYVSSTRARVVISDESNWAEAQNRQSIQIPTDWEDDEIRFILQPTEYLNSEHYLYVVDKHGAANEKGYPLVKAEGTMGQLKAASDQ